MHVNSVFTGIFTNRLVVLPCIALVMLAVFFMASSFTERSSGDLRARQVNLMVRQIGHRLLLQAGDSTSHVLPVTEVKKGTFGAFVLRFGSELVFSHDSLLALSQHLLPKTQFPSGYTVTVHDCLENDIVYGFQINSNSPDILPCMGRSQAPGCYTIEFAFPDFYESVERNKADIDQPTEERKSVKTDSQKGNSKFDESRTKTLEYGVDRLTEQRKTTGPDPQDAMVKPEEFKTTVFGYPVINLVYSGILVLLGVTLLIGRFGKIFKPLAAQHQNHTIIKEPVPELTALGKFLFDVKGQRLLLGSEVISLTDKECKILQLFSENFNELIPRETLMQKVWINEGVITGRSLDMFVSKLRKKLSSDPDLRITNVHGKGYKLETPGVQIL